MVLKRAALCAFALSAATTGAQTASAETGALKSEHASWESAVVDAVEGNEALQALNPTDVTAYCPNYQSLDATGRDAFWSNLLTHLADAESSGDPDRTRWLAFDAAMHRPTFRRGLFQISIEAAQSRRYQCAIATGAELTTPSANATCAVKMLANDVAASGAIEGAGRYWPTLGHDRRRARLAADVALLPPCVSAGETHP